MTSKLLIYDINYDLIKTYIVKYIIFKVKNNDFTIVNLVLYKFFKR